MADAKVVGKKAAAPDSLKVREQELLAVPQERYGADYAAHLVEQYKLYVSSCDNVSARRETSNGFFLSVSTAVAAIGGLLTRGADQAPLTSALALSACGIIVAFSWARSVAAYRKLNGVKFRVVHALEEHLPAKPFVAERSLLSHEDQPLSRMEEVGPWVFGAINGVLAVLNIVALVRS